MSTIIVQLCILIDFFRSSLSRLAFVMFIHDGVRVPGSRNLFYLFAFHMTCEIHCAKAHTYETAGRQKGNDIIEKENPR